MAEEVVKGVSTSDKSLPDDVLLIDIFLKLPVRSLLSFRSVSKHWHSLIKSPYFIHLHTNRPNTDSRFYHSPMLIWQWVADFITLLSDDETLAYKDDVLLDALFVRRLDSVCLLGPCNGVFCITDTFEITVFNPTTKRCRKVPHPTFPQNCSNFGCAGFGFDHVSNDYKVVWFGGYNVYRFDGFEPLLYKVYNVLVFSLSTNRWREVTNAGPNLNMSALENNLFVNGAFHCLSAGNGGDDSILVFDLNKESFKQFGLPNGIMSYFSFKLLILNESLAMVALKENNNHADLDTFHIWLMMEYGVDESWKKLHTISPGVKIDRSLSFGKDGEFFLVNWDDQLVSFNLNTRVIKEFQIQKPIYAFRYIESLVSLKKC